MRGRGHRLRDDRGSVTLETIILTPVIFSIVSLAVAAGEVAYTRAVVQQAAQQAVRAATNSPTLLQANGNAGNVVVSVDTLNGVSCVTESNSSNFKAFLTAPGSASTGATTLASYTVTCEIDMGFVELPGFPRTMTFSATAYSPLDPYRCRHSTRTSTC